MNCLVLENLSKYNPSKIQEIANRLNSSPKDIMLVCPVDKNSIQNIISLSSYLTDNNLSDIVYASDYSGNNIQILTSEATDENVLKNYKTLFYLRNNKFVVSV